MIKKRTPSGYIADIFFWGTVLGLLLQLVWPAVGRFCLLFGANSLYLFVSYGALAQSVVFLRICSICFCGYLLALIPAYYLVVKRKRYFPLELILVLDTVLVCACAAMEFLRENTYGVTILLPDIFISIAMCCVLMYYVPVKKKQM